MLNGFINIHKNSGISSNKVLSILKYHLKQNNINTKVGHFGTLDPVAEGVLPVALGRATRLFDYSLQKTKTYIALFKFGEETDTLDGTGQIVRTVDQSVSATEIEKVIPKLIGKVNQIPPAYSAKSIAGVRAYKLARQGATVDLPPKEVEINSITLLDNPSDNLFRFEIVCGGGTYIRSIVRDMAYLLGTVGYMQALLRTQSGQFTVDSAYNVDELGEIADKILPISYFTDSFKRYDLSENEFLTVKNGVPTKVSTDYSDFLAVYYQNELQGIGKIIEDKLIIKTWLL